MSAKDVTSYLHSMLKLLELYISNFSMSPYLLLHSQIGVLLHFTLMVWLTQLNYQSEALWISPAKNKATLKHHFSNIKASLVLSYHNHLAGFQCYF